MVRGSHRLVRRASGQHKLVEGVEAQAVDLRLMRLDLLRPRCIPSNVIRLTEMKGKVTHVFAYHSDNNAYTTHDWSSKGALPTYWYWAACACNSIHYCSGLGCSSVHKVHLKV